MGGYRDAGSTLPAIRPGIIFPEVPASRADAFYAKNYDWWQDLLTITRSYRRLA
jgi:hypothetical protein